MNDEHHEAAGAMLHRGIVEQRQYESDKAREEAMAEFAAMQARIRRLESALTFYADPFHHAINSVKIDNGQRARNALGVSE